MRKSVILTVAIIIFVLAGCNLLPDGRPAPPTATVLPISQVAATPAPPAGGSGVSGAAATNVPAPLSGTGRQTDVVRVVQNVGPAVVTVVNQLGSSDPSGAGEALGSGVIIDTAGHIITNDHVVQGQQSITVIYADGKKVNNVQLVGSDSLSDLAVLKVDGPVPATANLGDSNAILPGETVVAIGSALGDFRNTVTVGVISGVHRNLVGTDTSMEDMIQTDAAINHGNSGGPLINLDGQVIGINTAILRSTDPTNSDVAEGLGFAIPSNTVKSISAQLISKGKVSRPYLGVTTLAVTPSIAAYYDLQDAQGNQLDSGAFVREVRPGTPADRAGVQVGDVISGINDFKIDTDHGLGSVLTNFNPGDTVTLHLLRNGNPLDVSATLAEH